MEQYYMVRANRAGVFFGKIKNKTGNEVTLSDARRIWYWEGACSLSQLAMEGTKQPKNCKFSMVVDEITIIDAIEIIKSTPGATQNILEVPVWKI